MSFVVIGATLTLLVACLLVPALRRKTTEPAADSHAANVLYERRIAELNEDIESGELAPEVEEAFEKDIVRVTIEDTAERPLRPERAAPSSLSFTLILAMLFSVTTLTYLRVGDINRALGVPPEVTTPPSLDEVSLQSAVEELKNRLEHDPDNAEGWSLLGRSLMAMNQYDEASDALRRANELVPNAPAIMLQYADALAMQAGGNITPEAQNLIESVLRIDPDNITGLWLAGMSAAGQGNRELAVSRLKRAQQLTQAAGASTVELDHLIATLSQETPSTPESGAAIPIHLTIEVSENMQQQLTGDETLFVFAREVGVGGPPLAVRKLANPGFPHQTRLDQSMSMAPNFKLKPGQTVQVTARLTASGNALPQTGDLIGSSPSFIYPQPAAAESAPLTITIDSRIE